MLNSASCIDLIFAGTPNLIVESGILFPSLNVKCHHQIAYSKLSLIVVYRPRCQHLIWDYKKANVDHIRKLLKSVDCGFVLSS